MPELSDLAKTILQLKDIEDIKQHSAKGFWYLSAHTTIQPHNQAMWVQGFYRDKFVRLDDRWKIAEIKVEFRYFTPFEEGWAKTPLWELPG